MIAGLFTAIFIAIVSYLLVFWQYPDVPFQVGYILGAALAIYGICRLIKAKTENTKGDARILAFAGLMLTIFTFVICMTTINI